MFWRPISAPGSTKSCARCAHDIARALDAIETADIRPMRGLMVRFTIELAPIRGDATWRPTSGLVPPSTSLIWIDGAVHASLTPLADALIHEATHATGRAFRNHALLPGCRLHPQEHVAEEIAAGSPWRDVPRRPELQWRVRVQHSGERHLMAMRSRRVRAKLAVARQARRGKSRDAGRHPLETTLRTNQIP